MQTKATTKFETAFHEDVYKGFTDYPKHISSKYFYDEYGDKLFQDIMAMPEYYLTRCEYSILVEHRASICRHFAGDGSPFNLIELGAGDGHKTKILLKELTGRKVNFIYQPIDISPNVLNVLENAIGLELPDVTVETMQGTYFDTLEHLNTIQHGRKVLLFLGSNIGNLLHPQAVEFLKSLKDLMGRDDLLLVGFDQKKHPQTILNAYSDAQGITAAFNKNVLLRINRELDGNFDPDKFMHWEVYDPETGTARSYLLATTKHRVTIRALDLEVAFEAWESIHTEISQKYDDATVQWLADKAGLLAVEQYSDQEGYYKDYLFKKK